MASLLPAVDALADGKPPAALPGSQPQVQVSPVHPSQAPQQSSSSSSSSASSVLGPKQLTSSITRAHTTAAVLDLVCSHHSCFNEVHAATALHRTAKRMQPQHSQDVLRHPGYLMMLSQAEKWAPHFRAQATGNALWALHKLPAQPPSPLVVSLIAAMERNLPMLSSQELANSIYGLARLGHSPSPEALAATAEQASEVFEDLQGQVSYHCATQQASTCQRPTGTEPTVCADGGSSVSCHTLGIRSAQCPPWASHAERCIAEDEAGSASSNPAGNIQHTLGLCKA